LMNGCVLQEKTQMITTQSVSIPIPLQIDS
jgi:hypothetical protein